MKSSKIQSHCLSALHKERIYRQLVRSHLKFLRIAVQETDLSIYADADVALAAKEAVIAQRGYIESYIQNHPQFLQTLQPWREDPMAPLIVRNMITASCETQVGPMAAVAGAVAESVGRDLIGIAHEVIVENGGDIFLSTKQPLIIGVYAGQSPLSLKIGLRIDPQDNPMSVCTSSSTVGHSLSLGRADAVCVIASSCALADAAATAIGNRVQDRHDIQPAIDWGRYITGVQGVLIIIGDQMGMWGNVQIVPI